MTHNSLAAVGLCIAVSLLYTMVTGLDNPGVAANAELCVRRATSPQDLAKCVTRICSDRSISDLNELVSSAHCTIVLAAAWERVRRTMPDSKQHELCVPKD